MSPGRAIATGAVWALFVLVVVIVVAVAHGSPLVGPDRPYTAPTAAVPTPPEDGR
ncbi:hypothetical protein Psed_5810 [Pseudonocardia dioxanivorans CB1190]|uniref:Uncharacterized protein n=1 Tax=Pseudonocardia dioxanivorans (strain ATCC 55486 / DSM 44775 / JCM 13855 / CB1190) TaxID=675635 RepID=F4D1E7_PSEUX|nr:hypothetical protein [Pseudonocardia dioxanivorans]AEA27935.1 hypothetical protein Psed_5810 [Pseudonocardia dioxanivorans CB1190]